jgi:type IV secretion system protein VirD4
LKKIAALVLVEIIIILTLLLAMNMFMFRRISVSFSGVIFMFRIAARSGFRMVSFKVIAFLFVVVVFFTVQLVFMYQAIRKAVLDFRNRNRHSSGTARWATTRELKKLGLITEEPDGVILGQSKDAKGVITGSDSFRIKRFGSLISDNSAYHAIVVGATGSGKGVGVIMPTLLTWKESVMIVDPKGESYGYTAGYRSTFSEVFYFDPTITVEEAKERHIKPCHINPLDFIPRTPEAVAEIGNMCLAIHPNQSKEPFWDKLPRMMLEMLIGHVLIKGKKKSIPEAASIIMTTEKYETIFENILNAYEDEPVPKSDPLSPVAEMVQNNAAHFFNMATGQNDEQLLTHISTVKGDLGIYTNPASAEILSHSDFSLNDIMDSEKPISIYMCIPVKQIERIMPMFKLIYSLILKSFLGRDQKHKHKLLMLLDEFSQFKKFETIAEQIPFVRSYGIKIMAFIQSISQLNEYYGADGAKALMDNFQLKVYLRATSPETTEYFERQLGKETLLMKKTSFSHNRKSQGVESYSESTSEQGRSLLTAEEILNLPLYEMIIFRPGMYPYLGKKIQHYADKRFAGKLNLPVQPATIKPFTHDGIIKPEFPTELTEEEFRNINRFTLEIRERNEAEAEQREEVNHIENFFSSVLDEMLVAGKKTENEETSPEETNKDENITSSDMEDIDEDEEYY